MKDCKCKHSKTEVKEGNSKSKVITKKPGKVVQKSKMSTKLKESVEVTNWVKGLAEEKYHPFTSKNEILNLIKTKLHEVETASIPMPASKPRKGHNGVPEFLTYDSIISSSPAEAPTKPITKPTTTPKPKPKPFNPSRPLVDPGPSAGIKQKKSF
jgi:hypothetical protein